MRVAVLAMLAAAAFAAPAAAGEELNRKEQVALAKAERELLGLAKFAAKAKDWEGALDALRFAQAAWPDAELTPKFREQVVASAARGGRPKKSHAAKMEKKRAAAYEKVAGLLADAALSVADGPPYRFARYAGLVHGRCPVPSAIERIDAGYFEPYLAYYSKDMLARLERGEEWIDGEWKAADAVAKLNQAHRHWSDPWRIDDGIHELRAVLPYRQVRQALNYVGNYRRFFLSRFAGEWDLQPPEGLLPVILTRSRGELEVQYEKLTNSQAGPGAAFYHYSNTKLNPCFVSYEMVVAGGRHAQMETFEEILTALTHEVTHQICYEYSKHAHDVVGSREHQFWCSEGIANHYAYYRYKNGTWRLTSPSKIPMPGGKTTSDGPFYWCKQNKASLPKIADFTKTEKASFGTVINYHIAPTLSRFMLEGANRKYRGAYIKMLQTLHRARSHPGLWDECFPGVDMEEMQAEFLAFVDTLEVDE